jgi:hypothetical protein
MRTQKYYEKRKKINEYKRKLYYKNHNEVREKRKDRYKNDKNYSDYYKRKAKQFHHLCKKAYTSDYLKNGYDLTKIILLCANCHCIVHYGENTKKFRGE